MRDLVLNGHFGRGTTIAPFLLHRIRPPASRDPQRSDQLSLCFDNGNLAVLQLIPERKVAPTQIPFRFDAAILSRMRSEVTSRSNWAKDRSTLSVSRPIEGR